MHEETNDFCQESQDGITTKLQDIIENTHDEDYLLLTFENGEERDGKWQDDDENHLVVIKNGIQWQENG